MSVAGSAEEPAILQRFSQGYVEPLRGLEDPNLPLSASTSVQLVPTSPKLVEGESCALLRLVRLLRSSAKSRSYAAGFLTWYGRFEALRTYILCEVSSQLAEMLRKTTNTSKTGRPDPRNCLRIHRLHHIIGRLPPSSTA
jgi:hypothetical protein